MYRSTLVLLLLVLSITSANGVTSYHIGNSLTYDSVRGLDPNGLSMGYHVDTAKPLHVLWSDPNGVDFTVPSFWPTALLQSWDAVTLQPHNSFGSTLGDDVTNVENFVGYATDVGQFYVLSPWVKKTNWPYSDHWTSESIDSLTTSTQKKRAYFDNLMNRLDDVWMVPTGEVFFELDQRGIDLEPFYRDYSHLSFDLGRYVATATLLSTTRRYHPSNVTPWDPIDGELLSTIHETIWDVITSHPWSGYSDFNVDGVIDGDDLTTWESSGRGGEDFLAWQRQYRDVPPLPLSSGGGASSATSSEVPEPATGVMALMVLTMLHRRPRSHAA